MTGLRYQSRIADKHYDVIIIGSGLSGLTLASLQAKQGKSVLVLEKHYVIGGFTHTYRRGGYEWSTGLHYVGDLHREQHPLRTCFDYISGGNLHWHKLPDEYDRFIFPDRTVSLKAGKENFREEMVKHFPRERKAIDEYLKLIPLMTDEVSRMGIGRLLPAKLRKIISHPHSAYFRTSTWNVLRSLTSDEKLISVLTGQWGNYGLPPKRSSFGVHGVIAHHYLNGACFPEGGSGAVAKTIVAEITKRGGSVVHSAEVSRILVRNNEAYGVELENGDRILGSKIISSTGLQNTYGTLLGQPEKVKKVIPSSGYFSLTLGAQVDPDTLHHEGGNLWVYEGYDHDGGFDSYLANPQGRFPPMSYLSFPSLKDPTWKKRIGNKTAIDILGIADYRWFKEWEGTDSRKRGADYEKKKQELVSPYLETVYRFFPELKGNIDFQEISTPLTVRHYVNYQQGEIYGWELSPARYEESWVGPKTGIRNFYLTGQDIFMNGICGAMTSGLMTSISMSPLDTISQLLPLGVLGTKVHD